MIYYLQRERNTGTMIPSQAIMQFDTAVALSQSETPSLSPDFVYHEDGAIDILSPGSYLVLWSIAGMAGFATNGLLFRLRKVDYAAPDPEWVTLTGSSQHIKNSSFSGFAVVAVSQEEIDAYEKCTIALFHMADAPAHLTSFPHKASILIFGLDLSSLLNRLTTIETALIDIYERIFRIESYIYLSGIDEYWCTAPQLSGIGVSVIHAGHTYNFWGVGALSSSQTLVNGTTYYLLTSAQCPELLLYVGPTSMGTLWIETPTGIVSTIPIRSDATGIYFRPVNQLSNLPVGTTFRFVQTLILVDPDAGGP